ncbi:MAG TPA: hypothetical protein VKB38_03785 [Terracidiphilus sp.]|nr:hypothetical protein [Terracidiphilus sp.]
MTDPEEQTLESGPKELSLDYFESNPTTYSNRVLGNLKQNHIFRFIFENKGRGPTNKDMLIVASTVIASADEEIRRLHSEKRHLQREASRIRAVLGNPIWSVRQLPAPAAEETVTDAPAVADKEEKIDKAEYSFMAKYLTVGNTLGALVVVIGILGGIVTYFTTNFKDKAKRAEDMSVYWQGQATSFEKEAANARAAQKKAEDALTKQQESDSKTISDLKREGDPPALPGWQKRFHICGSRLLSRLRSMPPLSARSSAFAFFNGCGQAPLRGQQP